MSTSPGQVHSEEAVTGLQRAALLHGLPHASPDLVPQPHSLTPSVIARVSQWAAGQRLLGLLVDLLHELGVGQEALAPARALLVGHLRTSLVCEATAVRAVEALGSLGIESWLIKGLPVAHLDYADPAMRSVGDADVLVPRGRLHDAVAALAAAGFRRTEPAPHPRWEARYARAVMLRSEHQVELDVHASIAAGYFGAALDHAALVDATEVIDLGGVRCPTLGGAGRVVGSCYAAVLSRGSNLRYLRDLAQQLLITGVDWQHALAIARRGDGESVLAAAVTQAAAVGVVPASHPFALWAAEVSPSSKARHALRYAEAGRGAGWVADARSQLLALSFVDGLRFVGGVAIPPKHVRQARGLGFGEQLRRGVRFARLRR